MKKLKLEDTCLTIEQVRELQSLGIDFSNAVMEFTHYDNDGADEWFLTIVDDYADSEFADIENMPTLTNTEMLEMLPTETCFCKTDKGVEVWSRWLEYDGSEQCEPLLRDALFEMIKWLKTNKLM
jgi:hypothetical protein